MASILFLFFCSVALSLVLTPVFRDLFLRWNIVDVPNDARKLHTGRMPRIGGVPIAIAFIASHALLRALHLDGQIRHPSVSYVHLLPAVVLILAVGLIDDIIGLRPWQKLLGQVAASLIAVWAGVRVAGVHGVGISPTVAIPLTVLWLLACTNAFNLIDGVDGLAAGIGFFATITILIASFLQNNFDLALATLPLAGALLGFLRYNFNPATIFLGDSGSLLLGFLLGCFGTIWGEKGATLFGMTAPLIMLALPLLDVGLSIIRRFLRGQPIFGADRGHIHHRLLDRGLTPRRVALVLYGASGVFAMLALLASVSRGSYTGLVVVLFCGVTWFGVQHLNYTEFGVAEKFITGGGFRRILNSQLCLHALEKEIEAATNPDEIWSAICETANQLGFHHPRMRYCGREFFGPVEVRTVPCWEIHVPLSEEDQIVLCKAFDSKESSFMHVSTSAFVHVLKAALQVQSKRLQEAVVPGGAVRDSEFDEAQTAGAS